MLRTVACSAVVGAFLLGSAGAVHEAAAEDEPAPALVEPSPVDISGSPLVPVEVDVAFVPPWVVDELPADAPSVAEVALSPAWKHAVQSSAAERNAGLRVMCMPHQDSMQ